MRGWIGLGWVGYWAPEVLVGMRLEMACTWTVVGVGKWEKASGTDESRLEIRQRDAFMS